MSNTVRDKDKGWKKHKRLMKRNARRIPHVRVGVLGPDADAAHEGSDLTTIEVGAFHEFGRGNNPERSFIRANFDANEQRYKQIMRKLAGQVLAGNMTQERALKTFGEIVIADTRNFMAAGIPPEKADGDTSRLKVTGQLAGSVTSEVHDL